MTNEEWAKLRRAEELAERIYEETTASVSIWFSPYCGIGSVWRFSCCYHAHGKEGKVVSGLDNTLAALETVYAFAPKRAKYGAA